MKERFGWLGLLGLSLVTLASCEAAQDALPQGARAEDCATCHPGQFASWRHSAHATGAQSPVFVALVAEVERSWGPPAARRCRGCHSPGHGGDAGVGCVACHAAVGNHGERDGALVVDLSVPLSGPFSDPVATHAHRSRRGALLGSPTLCGTCHEVTGPNLFVEGTLSEYRAGQAAEAGLTCVDCHLRRLPELGPIATTTTVERPRVDHRTVGLDPLWDAPPAEAASAAKEAAELLRSALSLEATATPTGFAVTVTSLCIGHRVPTGVAMLRDLRVEVRVLDALGAVVSDDPSAIVLNDQPMAGGQVVALPTQAEHVRHNSLSAGESRRVLIDVPPDSLQPLVLEATLVARAFREDVLATLGLTELSVRVPTHTIWTASAQSAQPGKM